MQKVDAVNLVPTADLIDGRHIPCRVLPRKGWGLKRMHGQNLSLLVNNPDTKMRLTSTAEYGKMRSI
jgi:hypothetical protein